MNQIDLERDARNRALRTFLQGLGLDVLAAVALFLFNAFSTADEWGDLDWKLLGFLLAKTVTTTAASYVMRKYLDGSSVPTPLPPADPGEPADDVPGGGI